MPYIWTTGLIWLAMHDSPLGVIAWCAMFIIGKWWIDTSKAFIRSPRDIEAFVWAVELAVLTDYRKGLK